MEACCQGSTNEQPTTLTLVPLPGSGDPRYELVVRDALLLIPCALVVRPLLLAALGEPGWGPWNLILPGLCVASVFLLLYLIWLRLWRQELTAAPEGLQIRRGVFFFHILPTIQSIPWQECDQLLVAHETRGRWSRVWLVRQDGRRVPLGKHLRPKEAEALVAGVEAFFMVHGRMEIETKYR